MTRVPRPHSIDPDHQLERTKKRSAGAPRPRVAEGYWGRNASWRRVTLRSPASVDAIDGLDTGPLGLFYRIHADLIEVRANGTVDLSGFKAGESIFRFGEFAETVSKRFTVYEQYPQAVVPDFDGYASSGASYQQYNGFTINQPQWRESAMTIRNRHVSLLKAPAKSGKFLISATIPLA